MQINPYKTNIVQYIAELENRRFALAKLIFKKHDREMKKVTIDRLIAIQEANVTFSVATATNEDGKPKYTNETLRKSTIDTMLYSSKDYMDNLKKSDKLKRFVCRASAEIMVEDAMIKKFESLERLNFAEMEAKD